MGSADPRSFSRGKRGIAGSLVFTVFDKEVFSSIAEQSKNVGTDDFTQFWTNQGNLGNAAVNANTSTGDFYNMSTDDWENLLNNTNQQYFQKSNYRYTDEIMPFDVTITMHNEYGQSASMSILGVEILNEGSGYGIDDITTSKACTFIARKITQLTPGSTSWDGEKGKARKFTEVKSN
jgi:hypothetical protein